MIADVTITEKSFGPKILMTGIKFSVDDGEKVGVVGRNGVGKSTLFGILAGQDKDYSGEVIYRRGVTVVATAQEHHAAADQTVLQYVLAGLPEYADLSHIIENHPESMGDDMRKINEYTDALERFEQKGYYQIESDIEQELEKFQLSGVAHRPLVTLSGGQKRLVEVVKVMHSDAHLALLDEPTNHMDYIAKKQFIDWLGGAREGMLIVTHDRDVLQCVDRIIELKDGGCQSFKGNYDAYLRQNAIHTGTAMNDFELVGKRITNLKVKVIDYQRLKEKSRNPSTIQKFKRLENQARAELAELEQKEKPSFWIDKDSVENLHYKVAGQYEKFKAKNIRMNLGSSDESRSKHVLVNAKSLSLGYGDTPLFDSINIDLREGEALELRGRNGAGKTTLIKALLATLAPSSSHCAASSAASSSPNTASRLSSHERAADVLKDEKAAPSSLVTFDGTITLDSHVRVGIYEQEVGEEYFSLSLTDAIERMYLDRNLAINTTKIRQLLADYLFNESDGQTPISRLSGGQKARFQLIAMLANDPQLLILDEPTNHLDLPSIEELETALASYAGAILYVSHDNYFRDKIGGEVVQVGAQ